MFADASAIIAIIAKEPERSVLREKLDRASQVLVSPIAVYEATLGLARIARGDVAGAAGVVRGFLAATKAEFVVIDKAVGEAALDAFERFGKGRHRAGLNMGDCFAYACARAHGVPLLFKGDDFGHTDIRIA